MTCHRHEEQRNTKNHHIQYTIIVVKDDEFRNYMLILRLENSIYRTWFQREEFCKLLGIYFRFPCRFVGGSTIVFEILQ